MLSIKVDLVGGRVLTAARQTVTAKPLPLVAQSLLRAMSKGAEGTKIFGLLDKVCLH